MSNTKHTQSPWFIEDDVPGSSVGYRAIVAEDGELICDPSPMGEANARLIAAAPELLTALESLLNAANKYQDLRDRNGAAIFNAHAAIAKAKGE